MNDQTIELASVKEFRETFMDEFVSFESNARGLSQGQGSFSNSKKEWFAIGSISASVVITNAIFGLLAGLGVIAGVVSTGVGIGISLLGVVGGICYNRYRNAKNRQLYKVTIDRMDKENIKNDIDIVAACLINQHANYLATCTPEDAIQLAKNKNQELTTALVKGDMLTKTHVLTWANNGAILDEVKQRQYKASTAAMLNRLATVSASERAANLAFAGQADIAAWKQQRQPSMTQQVKVFFDKVLSMFTRVGKRAGNDVEWKASRNRLV